MSEHPDRVGLCRRCEHARIVRTPRSVFWRCALAEVDPRFDRYPRLPVLACDGYRPGATVLEPDAEPGGD